MAGLEPAQLFARPGTRVTIAAALARACAVRGAGVPAAIVDISDGPGIIAAAAVMPVRREAPCRSVAVKTGREPDPELAYGEIPEPASPRLVIVAGAQGTRAVAITIYFMPNGKWITPHSPGHVHQPGNRPGRAPLASGRLAAAAGAL